MKLSEFLKETNKNEIDLIEISGHVEEMENKAKDRDFWYAQYQESLKLIEKQNKVIEKWREDYDILVDEYNKLQKDYINGLE